MIDLPVSVPALILALNMLTLYILIPMLRWPIYMTRRQHTVAYVIFMGSLFLLAINIPLWVYHYERT